MMLLRIFRIIYFSIVRNTFKEHCSKSKHLQNDGCKEANYAMNFSHCKNKYCQRLDNLFWKSSLTSLWDFWIWKPIVPYFYLFGLLSYTEQLKICNGGGINNTYKFDEIDLFFMGISYNVVRLKGIANKVSLYGQIDWNKFQKQ